MSDAELQEQIARIRTEIARLQEAVEALAVLAKNRPEPRCYLSERSLGRKCEGA